jgi:hypothetical protein
VPVVPHISDARVRPGALPGAERGAVDAVELWHPRVTVTFDVAREFIESLLPLLSNQLQLGELRLICYLLTFVVA